MSQEKTIIPKHIAIIMDGNRRWARERGLPVLEGHRRVANDVLEKLVEHAVRRGVKYLTVWAFSTENWERDPTEVAGIMKIFRESIAGYGKKMHEKGICIRMIGDLVRFSSDIQKSIRDLIELTKNNTRITVTFALNYGGRDEIMRAFNKAISDKLQAKSYKEQAIRDNDNKLLASRFSLLTENNFSKHLDTSGIPDPEFIIRTGGEQRLSGFLLWQSEYSELYFPAWFMPEFTPEKLDEVLAEFALRKRRFGK